MYTCTRKGGGRSIHSLTRFSKYNKHIRVSNEECKSLHARFATSFIRSPRIGLISWHLFRF